MGNPYSSESWNNAAKHPTMPRSAPPSRLCKGTQAPLAKGIDRASESHVGEVSFWTETPPVGQAVITLGIIERASHTSFRAFAGPRGSIAGDGRLL
jgi:hypothetical protein